MIGLAGLTDAACQWPNRDLKLCGHRGQGNEAGPGPGKGPPRGDSDGLARRRDQTRPLGRVLESGPS